MPPSLFTRVAATEAELQAMEEILADVLDILAEVKADQNAIRQNHEAQGGRAKRGVTDQRRTWRQRLGGALSIFGSARFPIHRSTSLPDQVHNDELAFWKSTGRIAVAGLFLMTVFVIGLYQLLNGRLN